MSVPDQYRMKLIRYRIVTHLLHASTCQCRITSFTEYVIWYKIKVHILPGTPTKHVKRCEKWESDTDADARGTNRMRKKYRRKPRNNGMKMWKKRNKNCHIYIEKHFHTKCVYGSSLERMSERALRKGRTNERTENKNWFSIMQTYIFYTRLFRVSHFFFSFVRSFFLQI